MSCNLGSGDCTSSFSGTQSYEEAMESAFAQFGIDGFESGSTASGGTDYGALMAELFEAMAEKQYEAALKKEPAKANKTITQG